MRTAFGIFVAAAGPTGGFRINSGLPLKIMWETENAVGAAMMNYLKKVIRFRKMKKNCEKERPEVRQETDAAFSGELENDLELLRDAIAESSDLITRTFIFGRQIKAAIIYIDGLTDKALISETILKPLMYRTDGNPLPEKVDLEYVRAELLFTGSIDTKKALKDVVSHILSGDTAFLMDGAAEALVISLRGWQSRGIQEPQTESVVRGPREGFSETLRINTSLLRRKIKNPDLKFETVTIGERTGTDVCIAYIDNLAKPGVGNISVYARHRDYHDVLKGRLKEVAGLIARDTGADVKVFVDTAPLMEKPLAALAGIGWQGKHTNLVSREIGNWFFLGAIFTTVDLPPDPPGRDHCGSCRALLRGSAAAAAGLHVSRWR